ncbi:MAG: hypothetical protein ABI222_15430 [Opitutaceae bacterium]
MSEDRGTPALPAAAKNGRTLTQGWLWLVLAVAGYFAAFVRFPKLFFALGVNHYNVWFLDTFALLASSDAVTRGIDPYGVNPLDYLGRVHVYSHWWLQLHSLGLTRADAQWLGLGLVISFLLVALWRLRPHTAGELFWYFSVICSSPVLLALDRANNDLVVFLLLSPVVPCVLSGRRGLSYVAPVLIGVAAALKYYPAAAALLMGFALERKEWRPRLLFTLLCLALAAFSVREDLRWVAGRTPEPEGLLSFGAMGFFHEMGWTSRILKLLGVAIGGMVVLRCWIKRPLGDWDPRPDQRADWLYFILGAVLLTGCFFTSVNFGYRWIFVIWLAPFLWKLPRDPATPPRLRRLVRLTMGLTVVMLWWGTFCCVVLNLLLGVASHDRIMSLAHWAYLVEQPADWAFFICLLVFLTHFARRSCVRPVLLEV